MEGDWFGAYGWVGFSVVSEARWGECRIPELSQWRGERAGLFGHQVLSILVEGCSREHEGQVLPACQVRCVDFLWPQQPLRQTRMCLAWETWGSRRELEQQGSGDLGDQHPAHRTAVTGHGLKCWVNGRSGQLGFSFFMGEAASGDSQPWTWGWVREEEAGTRLTVRTSHLQCWHLGTLGLVEALVSSCHWCYREACSESPCLLTRNAVCKIEGFVSRDLRERGKLEREPILQLPGENRTKQGKWREAGKKRASRVLGDWRQLAQLDPKVPIAGSPTFHMVSLACGWGEAARKWCFLGACLPLGPHFLHCPSTVPFISPPWIG